MKKKVLKNFILLFALTASVIFIMDFPPKVSKDKSNILTPIKVIPNSIEKKEMNATLKFIFPGDSPRAQSEVTKAVEEMLIKDGLNLKLDFTFISLAQYWNKVSLIAASGEPYDIIWTHISNISNLVSKKALAPINEPLQNYGQNILNNTSEYAIKQVTINGKIYGVPRVMPIAENGSFVQIRGDLRKKYGVPEIKTVEDMDKYLEAIAKNEPNMIPYFYDPGRFLLREYGNVAFFAGEFLGAPVYIDPEDEQLKVKNTYESDLFKNILGKLREWKAKGYYSYRDDSKIPNPEAAFCEGKIASTWSVVLKQTERIDEFKAATPQGELENIYLHPEKPRYMYTAADNILSVLSTSKNVDESVAFINWVRTSQENYDLFSYGIKDKNYKLEGDSVSYDGITSENSYMPINWAWNDIEYVRFSKYISPEYARTLRNWDKESTASPTLGFVPDLSPIKTEIALINAITGEYLQKLYEPEVEWDSTMAKFRKKIKDAGIDHVIKEIQKQFDEFKESNKQN